MKIAYFQLNMVFCRFFQRLAHVFKTFGHDLLFKWSPLLLLIQIFRGILLYAKGKLVALLFRCYRKANKS